LNLKIQGQKPGSQKAPFNRCLFFTGV
jgi:hypothetical protein